MIATDNALLASTSTATYAIDLATHNVLWSYPVGGQLALSDQTLYIAAGDDSVYALSVPEPTEIGLIGLACFGLCRRRSR